MTKHAEGSGTGERPRTCRWCQRPLPVAAETGRPRRYCRQSCRQQAYLARTLADAHGLAEDQLVVDRGQLEAAQDRLALLRHALDDLERERAGGALEDLAGAFAWLHAHAVEVAALRLEPAVVAPGADPQPAPGSETTTSSGRWASPTST